MVTIQLNDDLAKNLLNWLNHWRNQHEMLGLQHLIARTDELLLDIAQQYKKQGLMAKVWHRPEIPTFVFKTEKF